MWTRRELMKAGLASAALAAVPQGLARAAAPATGRPRYFVLLFLRGGMDAIYTFDPKTRAQVAPKVDVPYGANDIVATDGMPFGPHFKDLRPWGPKMAVVRGVQVKTANHESGAIQVVRMKAAAARNMPGVLDIIGRERDGQPLGNVTLGTVTSLEHSPTAFIAPTMNSKTTLLDHLDALSAADEDAVAKAFRAHVRDVEKWAPSNQRAQTLTHLRQVAELFEKLPSVPRFKPEQWSERGARQKLAETLQRVLWMLEHDLTRTAFVKIFFDWDSHFQNALKQTGANADFAYIFDKFLTALHTRRNAHGVLADNTVLVTGSELGRFPILNANLGKDHFPETGFMVMGPGVRGGKAFGPTGRMMEGQRISLTTGEPVQADGTHLVLDDMGTTLLHMAGMDPNLYGYRGRRLRFLEA